ncbi:MAG TPA: Nif3-like dinuclear metal center hexameric protein [Pedobacter sp.]|nr:Nif3-like dinuclear metal center hexameric protein [Pedobacter sp.]
MKLALITNYLESIAPLNYQEDYDNAGLIVGRPDEEITAAIVALDCTEQIIDEAIAKHCNLIITHHPIVFKGLKKFNGKTYVERVVQKAIKNDIALYAIHTNLDHVSNGVSGEICKRLGIANGKVLAPKTGLLKKLVTFCPTASANTVKEALFNAGAGNIGNYSECSFSNEGTGTFNGNENTDPFVGIPGKQHSETEQRIEVIFKVQDERKILVSLLEHHPYEEVAYDIYPISNSLATVGAGMVGWLSEEMDGVDFLRHVKEKMQAKVIRHTAVLPKKIKKVAVCGGAGSFLLKDAIAAGADAFVTADFKYHEFFDAENKLIICDIGHYESEQFTSNLLLDLLYTKFPDLAIYLTSHNTNPVNYFS